MEFTAPAGPSGAHDRAAQRGAWLIQAARLAGGPGTVRVYTHFPHLKLELAGLIGTPIAEDLEAAFAALFREGRPLDIDAAGVTGMDDTGLSFVARCIWFCKSEVTLLAAPRPLRRYLAKTHLDQLVTINPREVGEFDHPLAHTAALPFVPSQHHAE